MLARRLRREDDLLERYHAVQELIVATPYPPHAPLADRLGQQVTPRDQYPRSTVHVRIIAT
jgi:hypothetical protein